MEKYSHHFVNNYQGLVAFGLDRKTDIDSIIVFLQRFSDDQMARLIAERMSQDEINELFDYLMGLMKSKLSEEEYHRFFLKD